MSTLKNLADRFARDNVRTVAVVDLQWGDAGKGKLVDWIGDWADIIARGTGGANAGHTIMLGEETHIFHLVPSGILHDREGKLNVIGRGVAVEPRTLANEIAELKNAGNSYQGLRISCRAHLVLPFDIALDRLKEAGNGASTIGTTGRGIGPVYESRVARIGLSVNDLLNKDVFAKRLARNLEARIGTFRQFDPALVSELLHSETLEKGIFWGGPKRLFDTDAVIERYLAHAEAFSELVVDTDSLMHDAVHKGQRVLLEGAQGVLLSVAYGTYPYVTSSDCSLSGLAEGVGLRTEHVDYTLGVVKGPYMTRVGKGPFPTELGGEFSDRWCGAPNATKLHEQEQYPNASVNTSDAFEQGVAIRRLGDEYGATTGRLRRVGWLDLPLLSYASRYGRKQCGSERSSIALTKVDVLNTCKTIKLCTGYRYEGVAYRSGETTFDPGSELRVAEVDSHVLEHCVPIYSEFPGWCSSLKGMKNANDLPPELLAIINEIERSANVRVDVLSIGADRDETIVL